MTAQQITPGRISGIASGPHKQLFQMLTKMFGKAVATEVMLHFGDYDPRTIQYVLGEGPRLRQADHVTRVHGLIKELREIAANQIPRERS